MEQNLGPLHKLVNSDLKKKKNVYLLTACGVCNLHVAYCLLVFFVHLIQCTELLHSSPHLQQPLKQAVVMYFLCILRSAALKIYHKAKDR